MALKDEIAKANAEIEKLSKELGKKIKVFDINELEEAQTYLKGLRSDLKEMNSDLEFIRDSFRDSLNELSKQNTELSISKSALRKISSISAELVNIRNEIALVDSKTIDKLEKQGKIQFQNLQIALDSGRLKKKEADEIRASLDANQKFLNGVKEIRKAQAELRKDSGVRLFSGLGELTDAIPGLNVFTSAFKDAEEASLDTLRNNKLLADVNLKTGKGLTADRIKALGLEEKFTDENGKMITGSKAAAKIRKEGLEDAFKVQSSLTQGTKALGAGLKKAFGPLAIFMAFADAILEANKQQVELQKSTMRTQEEALAFRGELQTAVAATSTLDSAFKANVVTTSALLENFNNLNKQFGFIVNASTDTLVTMTKLTKAVHLSEQAAGGLAALSISSGEAFADGYKNALGTSYELQRQVGVQFDLRQILEETANVTGAVRANLGGNIEAIAEAVTQAKLFGASLEDVAEAGRALLDFESSIRARIITRKGFKFRKS